MTTTGAHAAAAVDKAGRFLPRRSNLWAIRVGFWFGRGYSAKDVAAKVGERTSEGTVKGQVRRAGLVGEVYRGVVVPIEIPSWQRDVIAAKAEQRGLRLNQIIEHVLEAALVIDDLYDAVTDGKYD